MLLVLVMIISLAFSLYVDNSCVLLLFCYPCRCPCVLSLVFCLSFCAFSFAHCPLPSLFLFPFHTVRIVTLLSNFMSPRQMGAQSPPSQQTVSLRGHHLDPTELQRLLALRRCTEQWVLVPQPLLELVPCTHAPKADYILLSCPPPRHGGRGTSACVVTGMMAQRHCEDTHDH